MMAALHCPSGLRIKSAMTWLRVRPVCAGMTGLVGCWGIVGWMMDQVWNDGQGLVLISVWCGWVWSGGLRCRG